MPIIVARQALEDVDPDSLLQSARAWMADALDAYLEDAHRRVVAFAPIALEHLGKALLASRHPSLLVQLHSTQEQSLIALSGHGKAQQRAKMRTIGLTEVLGRSALMIGESPTSREEREQVVASRNGAMHIGAVSPEAARQVMTVVCRLTQWLLEGFPLEAPYFYGDRLDTATLLLEKRANLITEAVQKAILAARAKSQRILGAIDRDEARAELVATLEAQVPDRAWSSSQVMHSQRVSCPACKSTSTLSGPLDIDAEGEAEEDHGETAYHAWWLIRFMPDEFQCGVCGLHLETREALDAAGFETIQTLDPQDLEFDPVELYEPD